MNERQIKYTIELLREEGELFEIRVITPRSNFSGYFMSADSMLKELSKLSNGNVYVVINKINDACYSREQQERFIEKPKNTTSDNDIERRKWILIDIDPKRSSGVSSTKEEKETAKSTINKIYDFLRNAGFSQPIVCDSGNGFHLLYKVDLENIPDNTELIKKFLLVLDMYFTTKDCDIDKSVFNASRITKLYGTVSQKGNSTETRPHRESAILKVPDQVKETPIELIKKVVELYPTQEKPSYQNNYGKDRFDLDDFINKHGIQVRDKSSFEGGVKYVLNNCIFDESHKGKDAAIIQTNDGKLGYKCFHSSCSQYKWKNVREKFEPGAYSNNYEKEPNRQFNKKVKIEPQQKDIEKGDKFFNFTDIKTKDRSQIVVIKSGIHDLDSKMLGFNKGEITLWSGKNGSAKSTIVNQIAINAIDLGFKGIIFSGELPDFKMKQWIYLQCAGRQFVTPTKYENVFFVKDYISNKIDKWLKDKLYLYNNEYGNNFEQLICDIEDFIDKNDIDFVVLDNLMALDLLTLEGDKYQQQTKFINRLCGFVKKKNIHLHIVAHPRKNIGFLRKEDISGTADLTNAVDNVIICHRNNNDYKKAIGDFFGKEFISDLTLHDNYIEVCKNRDMGVIDKMFGLFFERESKRLLNELYENRTYGWQDLPGIQTEIAPNTDFASKQFPIIAPKNELPINTEFENNDYINLHDDTEPPF